MRTSFRSVFLLAWLSARILPITPISPLFSAEKDSLSNGLVVIYEHNDSSPTTFLQLLIRGGKSAEPEGKKGLSFLTTRLAVEIPDSSKAQELLRLASSFSVSSRGDYSLINIECLTEGLEATLRILARVIASPLFSGMRVDSIKKYMAHQAKVESDDSLVIGHLAALASYFGEVGYGWSSYGDEKSLAEIRNRDVADFYRKSFTASNVVISVSSDQKKETLMGVIEKAFGSLPSGKPMPPAPVALRYPEKKDLYIPKETKQHLVCLAFGLAEIEPRRYAMNELIGNFLGKGSGSKLWPLRSEAKLAYNVNCRVTQMQKGGILEAYLETDGTKKDQAIYSLREVLNRVNKEGMSMEEFEASKAATKTNFLRDNELKDQRMATLGSFEMLGLGFDYMAKFPCLVDSLTLEEVNAYFRATLDLERALLIVVGPAN